MQHLVCAIFIFQTRSSIRGVQMTFTPGTIERSKILKLGMSNECFWIVQEMGEYPKTINVLGKECVSYK